jgi:hypothetical protein
MSGKNVSNVFIVDCENVGAKALEAAMEYVDDLDNSEVVLFLSQNVGKDTVYKMMNVLANTGAVISVEWHNAVGKNALDAKIITYLTLRISENCKFFIISNDKGYLASTEFLTMKGYGNASLLRPSVCAVHESGDTGFFDNVCLGYA